MTLHPINICPSSTTKHRQCSEEEGKCRDVKYSIEHETAYEICYANREVCLYILYDSKNPIFFLSNSHS